MKKYTVITFYRKLSLISNKAYNDTFESIYSNNTFE